MRPVAVGPAIGIGSLFMMSIGAAFVINISNMGQHRHRLQASYLAMQQTSMVAVGELLCGTRNVRTAVALSLTVPKGSSARRSGRLFTIVV